MKEIQDIKEVQKYLFNIAVEVDKILSSHNISLIMAYGSLLGAVRHGGFIPWDDDMDFYIPYSRYKEAWTILAKELPTQYEVVSFESNNACESLFYKVHDKRTFLNDKMSYGYKGKKLGINIDLFPLVENISGNDVSILKYKRTYKIYRAIYGRDPQKRPFVVFAKKFLQAVCPISKDVMRRYIVSYADKFKSGSDSFSYLANLDEKEIIPMHYFGELAKIKFEDYEFTCPQDVDGYLTFYFGDYMKLPPKEKQKWHNEGAYIYD